MKINTSNIILHTNSSYELLISLIRLAKNDELQKLIREFNLNSKKEIHDWVKNTLNSFNDNEKELLNYYFGTECLFSLGLIEYINSIEFRENDLNIDRFINGLKSLELNHFLYYLLKSNYVGQKPLSPGFINNWINNGNLFEIIDSNFNLDDKGKWMVYKTISRASTTKKEFVDFLFNYYHKHFKSREEVVLKTINNYINEHIEELINSVNQGMKYIFTEKSNLLNTDREIKVIVSYFGEYIDIIFPSSQLIIVGYKFPEYASKVMRGKKNLEEQAHVFKALGDKTRLLMLQHLSQGPSYMTELGEKLNISNPTVNYHLKKFINSGLIRIDKEGNRIYYKLCKDRIKTGN